MHIPRLSCRHIAVLSILSLSVLFAGTLQATNVIMRTPLGDVEIELFDETQPQTVANFLNYVNSGAFVNSFVHRSMPGFVVQGGGFTFDSGTVSTIASNPPVVNEPGISNLRGTIAMAKLGGDPNSATSQWFINLADNSSNLDDQNGGFTVFGQVVGNGMQTIDAIAELTIWNAGGAFTNIPLIDFPGTGNIMAEHLVFVDVDVVTAFDINAGITDTWLNPLTGGQGFFITVYPTLGQIFMAWFTYDTERPDASVPFFLGEAGHRWITAFGNFVGNRAELTIEITSGGVFDAASPAPTQVTDGTIILEFTDCENGTVTYNIPSLGLQSVVPIQRIAPDNVARCQQLATQQ